MAAAVRACFGRRSVADLDVGRTALAPDDRGVVERHAIGIGAALDEEVEAHVAGRERAEQLVAEEVFRGRRLQERERTEAPRERAQSRSGNARAADGRAAGRTENFTSCGPRRYGVWLK